MSEDNQPETNQAAENENPQNQAAENKNSQDQVDNTSEIQEISGNALSNALALKDNNPKLFYGAIGAITLIILVLISSGGGNDEALKNVDISRLSAGQKYSLKSPNSADPAAKVRLVSVPGSTEAYDDTEEADRVGNCKHMPQGTPVEVLGFQDAYGKEKTFSQVKILEGECKDQTAWTLSINVQ